jgi:hypothetical protein
MFIFDLLYKRISSSPCIDSVVVTLFIKQGKSLFRGGHPGKVPFVGFWLAVARELERPW